MRAVTPLSTAKTGSFAQVALPVPIRSTFTYEIPTELRSRVFVGCRVEVPFGRRTLSGIVLRLTSTSDVSGIKPLNKIYDTYLASDLLELAEWIASYYGCTIGEAAQSVLPPLLKKALQRKRMAGTLVLKSDPEQADERARSLQRAPKQLALANRLRDSGGRAAAELVSGEWGFSTTQIRALIDKGFIELDTKPPVSKLDNLEKQVHRLNADQETVYESIVGALGSSSFRPMLLHGVTGSGKTEIYLRAARSVLAAGGGCIVLVPEIGLLPQAIARYQRVFGDELAVLHSRLTGSERFDMWQRIEKGKCRVVLGPRSAVFSPVRHLRLIIVDEEQDESYKQDDKPRYHARSVALMRGKRLGLTVLLGSATPSAETLSHARSGRYAHLRLPTRVGGTRLPAIEFVDMRTATTSGEVFSARLLERLDANIDAGKQSILFLNKRGHARFVMCSACGWVAKCQNCDISLVYHRVSSRLKCHFCGYGERSVSRCPSCQGVSLHFSGVGTQRVEIELNSLYPGVKVLRMDADTTSGKEGHRKVLERFGTGDYPVLIGTQMVAKGHHFPNVNLVGVLFAEESLNYPDFRSAERTFRQLIQVAGRAGRDSDRGEVIVQTYTPDNPVFKFLGAHDYDGFMTEELATRQELRYPPFSRLVLASFSAAKRDVLERVAQRWAGEVRRITGGRVDVLGPVAPLVARVKNRYREQLLIKGDLTQHLKTEILDSFARVREEEPGGRTVEIRWDVDPESFF